MKRQPKRVQTNPFTFQDWWDKHGHVYGVEAFKPCRAAWNAAKDAVVEAAIERKLK